MSVFALAQRLVDRGLVPDALVRAAIRRLNAKRLAEEYAGGLEETRRHQDSLAERLRAGAVAVATEAANEQHYEVPAAFFEQVLGARLKYSSAYFPPGVSTLDAAEEAMLALTCERALLADGQDVLELGCGWGSLTLFMAERFPLSRIHAVSNSSSQREHILARARARGLANVTVETADVNVLEVPGPFDRVVSVEMLEHVQNHERLLERIARWLAPGGKLFVHIFCHRELTYTFETAGPDDWMGRHFFTGGLMPSAYHLALLQKDLVLEERWRVEGEHYARTARAWLENLDARRGAARAALATVHGRDADVWVRRWRVFFMACEELFSWRRGTEWFVSHYRFARPAPLPAGR
ncbi:MAG: cyclopropane-fatty-acyl-phospholipid synthase family protein [Planctomycetota bacterium]